MDLQYALLLIGVIIVAVVAVTAYDKARLNRRRKPRQYTRAPAGQAQTATAPRARVEPVIAGLDINPAPPSDSDSRFLKTDAVVSPPAPKSRDAQLYEDLEDFEQVALMPLDLSLSLEEPEARPDATAQRRQNMPDEEIDFVIDLPGPGPVLRDRALGIYKQNEYLLEKPHHIYGLGYRSGLWSNVEFDPVHAEYRDISLAIQMVDSKGPISESELNTFTQMALKLADALQRPTKLPLTFEQGLERARALDEFCETNDVLASINIVANGPTGFGGRDVDQVAARCGMHLGAMNIYHKKNDNVLGCRHLFSLANLYKPGEFPRDRLETFKTQGLTLFMNVPCAYQPVRVFEQMVTTAKELCRALDGRLMDQDQKPLTEPGILVIRTQIERIAADMQEQGIVPGSPTAMRLF